MEQQRGSDFSQDVSSSLKGSSDARWKGSCKVIAKFHPLRYLLQQLQKAWSSIRNLFPMGALGSRKPLLTQSPKRPIRRAKKCLDMATHVLLAFIPSRLQQALGVLNYACLPIVSEEVLKSPVKPSGKGNKRKQDDLILEEDEYWVEILERKLPEDVEEEEDPTYEPTKSETDSEEYKSQNDTEVDLEYERKDGILMLKEDPVMSFLGQDQTAIREGRATNGSQELEDQMSDIVPRVIQGLDMPGSGNSQDDVVAGCGAGLSQSD